MHQNRIHRRRQAIPTDFSGVVVYVKPGQIQARIRNTALVNHYTFKSVRDIERRTERDGLVEFDGQNRWKHLMAGASAASALASTNAVEDTYLAD
jgi:hypothetical protein